jgi:hypothetical protein
MKQRLAVVLVALFATLTGAQAQISGEFFAMHSFSTWTWPTSQGIQFSSWRSSPVNIEWSDVNPQSGIYDWSNFDSWVSATQAHGQSMLYTVFWTPAWASTCPTCSCVVGNHRQAGGCYPPSDLNPDGTGTDQHLKDFMTALMQHAGPGAMQYIEVWNEPNVVGEFNGTIQQLVRMTSDIRSVARSYDPNIVIVGPAETGDGSPSKDLPKMTYLLSFLAAGGGQYVDVIALHGYVAIPENVIARINSTTAAMAQYGQTGKPIFITEGSWYYPKVQFPVTQQPGFSFRHYLSILSTPVSRFYLMAFFDVEEGNLWNSDTGNLTSSGTAYQLYYDWLVGATMTQPCQLYPGSAAVWSCTFTRSGGYQAAAVWNTALPWGQTMKVTVPTLYSQYRDLYGNVTIIKNHQVPIGYDPIWLEN